MYGKAELCLDDSTCLSLEPGTYTVLLTTYNMVKILIYMYMIYATGRAKVEIADRIKK
jgi:hypothetical protein